MLLADNIETLRLNITDYEALKIRERELERGAEKVNISRVHSGLVQIEIHHRTLIEINSQKRIH
ncbi:hypothetical protein [Thiofilum flexile]|uniref:hypothetical protein n=1 Tax=Thiofilum flexile TaxID=125627 RepID=UPI00037521BF|nr:hypothetical protein [Thiofilum flexile]